MPATAADAKAGKEAEAEAEAEEEEEEAAAVPAPSPYTNPDDEEWVDAEEFDGDPLDLCINHVVRVPCYIKDTDLIMVRTVAGAPAGRPT